MQLKKKLSRIARPLVAGTALFLGSHVYATAPTPDAGPQPSKTTATTKTVDSLKKYEQFAGKDFDQRMYLAEKIVQQTNLKNNASFTTIGNIYFQDARDMQAAAPSVEKVDLGKGTHVLLDFKQIDRAQQLYLLGHTASEIDFSLPYEQQLRFCGFDALADLQAGTLDPSKLFQKDLSRLFAQFETSELLAKLSNNDKAYQQLSAQLHNPDVDLQHSEESVVYNRHKLTYPTAYELKIAKTVAADIAKEAALTQSKQNGG